MSVSLSKSTYEVLNKQITEELASYYLYLGMASALSKMGMPGCANWMRVQAEEEQTHAMKIYEHIEKRGEQVKLLPIAAPEANWETPVAIFEEMKKHEELVTSLINSIYETAISEKDYATMNFIQWFIEEQVEEEDTACALLDKIKRLQNCETGMALFDAELGKRK